MASFCIPGSTTLTTTRKTVASVTQPAAATALGLVHRVHLGSKGTPTDASIDWLIQRTSTLGTATTVTPVDEDDTGSTATLIGKSNATVEPTYVANSSLFDMGINQRATYTIMLGPGREWRIAVTNNRGISVGALHASYASTVAVQMAWSE